MIKKVNFIFFLIAVLVLFSCILISCENQWMQELINELKEKKERGDSLAQDKDDGGYGGGNTAVYNIGDTGPGGGIVFYDKGYSSENWRYLEVALTDLGPDMWASTAHNNTDIPDAVQSLGKGKSNTDAILAEDANAPAAKACKEYRGGGKNDWFLPSKDELNLLYLQVQAGMIGGFSGEYWSSSQYDSIYINTAWSQDFSNGTQNGKGKIFSSCLVLPIRAF